MSEAVAKDPFADSDRWSFPLFPWLLRLFLIAIAFINNFDLGATLHTAESTGNSMQALVKLVINAVAGLVGAWGWWRYRQIRSLFLSLPGFLLIVLSACYLASALTTSIVPKTNALVASVLFLWGLLFIATCVGQLGGRQTLLFLWIGILLFVLSGCALHVIRPELTQFVEIMDLHLRIERFGGLGHPNTQGRFAMFCLVIVIATQLENRISWKWLLLAVPILLGVVWATMSRTPLVAGFAAISLMGVAYLNKSRILMMLLGLLIGLIVGLLALQVSPSVQSLKAKALQKVTKTGNLEEVTTLTGRTDIWELAWDHAMDHPLFGNGPGATPILLEKMSGHAHNVILDVAANLGLPAAFAVFALFVWQCSIAIQHRQALLRGSIFYLVVSGLTERLMFGNIPESMTYVWLTIAFWALQLVRGEDFWRPIESDLKRGSVEPRPNEWLRFKPGRVSV